MEINYTNLNVYNVLVQLASDIELMNDPYRVKWRCLLSELAYEVLKETPGLIFQADGAEFVQVTNSSDPTFAIKMRIAAVFLSFDEKGNKQAIALREIDHEPEEFLIRKVRP